jgi:hypothetical protein
MSKVANLVFFGAGYVLGARAGRSRYDELKRRAARLAEHPVSRQLAGQARDTIAPVLPAPLAQRLNAGAVHPVVQRPPSTALNPERDPETNINATRSTVWPGRE